MGFVPQPNLQAALPKSRRANVLAIVRYLRVSLMDEDEIERQYDRAAMDIRETAKLYNITQADIDAEIQAARDENARRS